MGVPISNVTRRVVFAASGTGPYSFTFEILANTDIAVYKDDALLTLTTDYTVTINANGTGSITLTAAPTGATQIAIVGNRSIARTTDFVTGGDFFANTVNDELDQQTIFNQQNAEGLGRALQAPQTDPTTIDMTLPRASVRAGKVLAFDANGDPTTGEVIGDFRGNWASGTAYNKRDIIKDTSNSNIYYCVTAHTASGSQPISTNADSAKWSLIIDAAAAAAAQAAAEAAQAAAETAEANAETAETNAETAETNAETAATAAASSASAASTSATNAASSASAASSSASTASTKASEASTSATNAASSASSASSSASSASSSASSASTSASNASTSATNAASSASSASTSASTATTQATNAASSASAAATSATNAASSASTASTQATNAANSATAAAASAASAASSLDSFDDRYLGSKASDPTLDNDGNALVTGALYYSTTSQSMKVYDGANWITATAAGTTSMLRYRYVATAGQTTFTGADANSLTLSYTSGNIVVVRNGSTLEPAEYTASNGTSIVLAVAASLNDVVDIIAFKSFTVADTYTQAQADALLVNKQPINSALTAISAVGYNGFKNRIINGAMVIDQRNGGAAITGITNGAYYPVDRFSFYNQVSGTWTAQQVTDAPAGFISSLKITVTSAASSGTASWTSFINQYIEGYNVADIGFGTANCKQTTLSFWVKSSIAGAFTYGLSNGVDAWLTNTFTINSANTWQQIIIQVPTVSVGAWNTTNGRGLQFFIGTGSGSNYVVTPSNTWVNSAQGSQYIASGAVALGTTLGATFQMTGVQLEVGTVATSFDFRSISTELALCQRYYAKINSSGGGYNILASATASSTSAVGALVIFPVTMRSAPTFSYANLLLADNLVSSTVTSIGTVHAGNNTANVVFNGAVANLTLYRPTPVISSNTTAAYIDMTAEL